MLDSDLYSSLPPGNYVIYSGVYTDRRSAEVALKGLRKSFPSAAVIEVSERRSSAPEAGARGARRRSSGAVVPGPAAQSEITPPPIRTGGASEPGPDRAAEAVLQAPAPDPPDGRERAGPAPDASPAAAPVAQPQAVSPPPRAQAVQPAAAGAPAASRLRRALERRREQLASRYGELQSDLGGLVYEMAIRDHFRLDVVVRRAAELQAVDAELTAVEQALAIGSTPTRPPPAGPAAHRSGRGRVLRSLRRRRGATGRRLLVGRAERDPDRGGSAG